MRASALAARCGRPSRLRRAGRSALGPEPGSTTRISRTDDGRGPGRGATLDLMASDLTVIVLAAGGGTRMKSKTMKVLHPIGGRSMIGHVLAAVRALEPAQVVAVVGHQREQVGPHIQELVPDAVLAVQETQDGTGHAVRVALEALATATVDGTVLVAYGDTPLLEGESLRAFAAGARGRAAGGQHPDRRGRRPVRLRPDRAQRRRATSTAIVEEKDATAEQRGDPRDQLRHPRLRRGVPRRRAAADRQRQRQGRVLPHRHRRASPATTA